MNTQCVDTIQSMVLDSVRTPYRGEGRCIEDVAVSNHQSTRVVQDVQRPSSKLTVYHFDRYVAAAGVRCDIVFSPEVKR